MYLNKKKADWLVALLCGLAFLAVFALRWMLGDSVRIIFGAEYGNIAESLVQGEGFANPFGGETGPTAWMPPLLSYLIAAVFYLFGVKTTAAGVVLILMEILGFTLTTYLLLAIGRRTFPALRWLLAVAYAVYVLSFHGQFNDFHDIWLIQLALTALLYGFVWLHQEPDNKKSRWLLWGVGLSLPLISPVLVFIYALLWMGWGVRRWATASFAPAQAVAAFTPVVVAGAAALLTLLPWAYRNYVVFDRFIPVKSNFWYEVYLGSVKSEGIYDNELFVRHHPYGNASKHNEYETLGEAAFLEKYQEAAQAALDARPELYWQGVLNRSRYIFLFAHETRTTYVSPRLEDPNEIAPPDLQTLVDEELVMLDGKDDYHWVSLEEEDVADFQEALRTRTWQDATAVQADWERGRAFAAAALGNRTRMAKHLAVSLLPFLSLLVGLMIGALRRNLLFRIVASAYLLYFLPYVFVAVYERYLAAAMPLTLLLTFCIANYLVEATALGAWLRALGRRLPVLARLRS